MFTTESPDAQRFKGTNKFSMAKHLRYFDLHLPVYIYTYVATFSNGEVWNEAFARFAEFEANTSLFSIRWKWIPSRILFWNGFYFRLEVRPESYITFTVPYGLMFTPEITLYFCLYSKWHLEIRGPKDFCRYVSGLKLAPGLMLPLMDTKHYSVI